MGYYGSSYFDGTVVMVTNVADFTTASSSALTNIFVIGRCAYVPDGAVLSAFCKEDNKAYHFYHKQTSFSRTGQPYRTLLTCGIQRTSLASFQTLWKKLSSASDSISTLLQWLLPRYQRVTFATEWKALSRATSIR